MEGMGVRQVEVLVRPDGRVDTKNASAYLGLSEKTLAMLRCSGRGPKYIKRGKIFYYLHDLNQWLQSGEAKSTGQSRSR